MVKPSEKLIDELIKDDELPSNVLEWFIEYKDVLEMIESLSRIHNTNNVEKAYQIYSEILSRYQEQPHLLDPHLNELIEKLINFIKDEQSPDTLIHVSFKYLHKLSTVRTYKVLVKFLPHELSDLEFALNFLEKQSISDSETWETRYMLLLWMSILVLNPFHMSRLDAFTPTTSMTSIMKNCENNVGPLTKMERIFNLCKIYSYSIDSCATVGAYLSAKYLIRNDVKEVYLSKFFDWIIEINSENLKLGQLAAISAILKYGKREDLLPYGSMLLKWILDSDYKNKTDFLKNKYFIKILQRLGKL